MTCDKQYPSYSVLMSVYGKDSATYFQESLESVLGQTISPSQVVLVCDGPLTEDLDEVIDNYSSNGIAPFKVVRLNHNHGLGYALRVGINECDCEIIARMDADDIALPFRCEKQLEAIVDDDYDIVSGTVLEFLNSPDDIVSSKTLPSEHKEILAYSKKRNPFNHPAVMYKKSAVLDAGSYQDFFYLEDYHLWIRMLSRGAKGKNIAEPMLLMRVGSGMYSRRGGRKYIASQIRLFSYMRSIGYITRLQWLSSVFSRTVAGLVPSNIRALLYQKLLRKQTKQTK